MISRGQDIAFEDTAGLVTYTPTQGRPSSVTSVAVYDGIVDDDGVVETALGSPSVTTNPNTTVDANSSGSILNVTATTGFETTRTNPAAQYLVTGSQGEQEWFQVVEVASASSLVLAAPLFHAYVATNTVETTRIQATINATWIADKTNISGVHALSPAPRWRVRWVYVVDSVTHVRDSYFDVVRYPGNHEVTAIDIENHIAGWIDLLPEGHKSDQGQRLIDDGNRMVRIKMIASNRADQLARDDELMNHLTILHTIERWAYAAYMQAGNDRMRQRWVDAFEYFNAQYDALVGVTQRLPMSQGQGGGATNQPASHLLRR